MNTFSPAQPDVESENYSAREKRVGNFQSRINRAFISRSVGLLDFIDLILERENTLLIATFIPPHLSAPKRPMCSQTQQRQVDTTSPTTTYSRLHSRVTRYAGEQYTYPYLFPPSLDLHSFKTGI